MVIKCPNCNHYVSDTAEVCPKCGIELKKTALTSKIEREIPSEINSKLIERGDRVWMIYLTQYPCCSFCVQDDSVGISISSGELMGNVHLAMAQEIYQKFKQSRYFQDFVIDQDNLSEESLEFIANDITDNARNKIGDINIYFSGLLQNVFGITSLRQIQIECVDNSVENEDDSAGIIMNVLCFLVPIIGFVLYFVKKNNYPNTAKSYIIWSAIGFGVSLLYYIMS